MSRCIITLTSGILFIILNLHAGAQNYAAQRGHAGDDLYVFCRKNITSTSIQQFYLIGEHGQKISVQYTIPYPATDNDLNLKNFVADPTPGILFCTSLTNADTSIYKSTDSGKSWQRLNTLFNGLTPPISLLGGSVAGEIITTERLFVTSYNIGSTNDYFATHTINATHSSYFTKPEVGITSGELYGINNAFTSSRDFLLHSADFGVTIDTIPIDSAVVYNPNGNQAQKICHGTQPGEIYLVTTEAGQTGFPHIYTIYHSTDYGHTYALRSSAKFDETSSCTEFTGGREDCSFYELNWKFDPILQCQVLQVFYSSDCGLTFTLFEHTLDDHVDIKEIPETTQNKLLIYPNPASDNTVISCKLAKPSLLSVEVYSAQGACVFKSTPEWNPDGDFVKTIFTKTLSAGLYTIQLRGDGKTVSSGTLLISR